MVVGRVTSLSLEDLDNKILNPFKKEGNTSESIVKHNSQIIAESARSGQISGITTALEQKLDETFKKNSINIPIELDNYMVELTIQNPEGSSLYSGLPPEQEVANNIANIPQYLVTLKLKDKGQNTFADKLKTLEEIVENNKEDRFFVPISSEKRKLIVDLFKEKYGPGHQMEILNTYLEQPFFQQGMVKEGDQFSTRYNFIIRPNQSIPEIEHDPQSVYEFTNKLREIRKEFIHCEESSYMLNKMISSLENTEVRNYSFKNQEQAAEFLERNGAIKKDDSKHIDIYVNGEVVLQFYGPREDIMKTVNKFDELLSLASLKTIQDKGYVTPIELE